MSAGEQLCAAGTDRPIRVFLFGFWKILLRDH